MSDLTTEYLGLSLRTPLVASASPLTADLDGLRRLEDVGAAAAVLPSLFEEQIELAAWENAPGLAVQPAGSAAGLAYFPDLDDYNQGPDRYLELVRSAKASLDIPVIGSLNGTTPGDWIDHAKRIEQAGADALELNLYLVAADPEETGEAIEARCRELVSLVRATVSIPLAVKLGPYFTSFARTAVEIAACGANGLVLFNRFYQPDLDLETLEVSPLPVLSHPDEVRLPLRWIAILRDRIAGSLAATTGVHSADDVLKLLLTGADVAMLASSLLRWGIRHLGRVERDLIEWLEEQQYGSVRELRGRCRRTVADPNAFERANYVRTLRSFSKPTSD